MTIEEIEAKIRAAVEAQRAKGIEVGMFPFVSDDGRCMCPLGCLLADAGRLPVEDECFTKPAEELLGVARGWAWDFATAFDGGRPVSNEATALGAKLRAEYITKAQP